MFVFASRSRSRSLCLLIDILADNRYFQNAQFKPIHQARQKRIVLVLLQFVLELSLLQIRAKLEVIRLGVQMIEWLIIDTQL